MTHASHFYPQGTNLYFIFIARMDGIEEYVKFQEGIIDRIEKNGGSLSHHHGVGKMISPWMERHIGMNQMDILRSVKKHFDPHNIMNPGGTLGLDLENDQKAMTTVVYLKVQIGVACWKYPIDREISAAVSFICCEIASSS